MQSQNKIQSQTDRYKKKSRGSRRCFPSKHARLPARWYALRKCYHAKNTETVFPPTRADQSAMSSLVLLSDELVTVPCMFCRALLTRK